MRIKEFSVFNYGPLPERDKFNLGNFNLLFGYNEEGKTLTIDALVKMLLGRSSRGFERINRVEEHPEGYVIVEKEGAEAIKFPESGNLTGITGLTANECRNIFIIRDSDLSISREEDFYKDVTNRLVGLQTEEIARIITELRFQGSLTLKGDFQDTTPHRLKSRLTAAERLTGEIDERITKLEEANFEGVEEELRDIETGMDNIEQELELFEHARKRDKYREGKESLKLLQDAKARLRELFVFNREGEQQWQEAENNLKDYEREKNKFNESLEEEEKKAVRLKKSVESEQFAIQGLTRDQARVEEHLKPKIIEYRAKEEEINRRKLSGPGRFLSYTGPLATLVFVVSLLGLFFWQEVQWADISALAALVIVIVYGGFLFSLKTEEKLLAELLRKIKNGAEKLKVEAETPEAVLEKIDEFNSSCAEKEKKIQDLEKDIAVCNQRQETLKENLAGLEKKRQETEAFIESLKEKTGVESLKEYRIKLKEKERNEQQVKTQQGVLTGQFGVVPRSDVALWEEKVSAFEEYEEKARGIEYSEEKIRRLKQKRDDLRNTKQELGYKLESFRKEADVLGREVNDCLALANGYIPCETVKDLHAAREKLQEFISYYEKNREYAGEAINIFKEIADEEEKKIQDLFGRESVISGFFSEITGGHYTEVSFNREKAAVEVLRSDGSFLEAWKLSGGTYDQLYLCIRLSLGGELLQGEKGFFILDDPFLKSDTRRLNSQLEVLRKVAENGWQIIFFTAKDEVKQALSEEIESGRVNLIEI